MTELKTIGPTAARLVAAFSQRDPAIFSIEEARAELAASAQVTSNLLSKLVRQGWIVRVRRGVYEIAPLWATRGSYESDRFAALGPSLAPPYYIAYRSALELYGWLQHPVVGRVWVAVPGSRRVLRTPRDRVVWVVTRPDRFEWGLTRRWIGAARVSVSDPERTFLDCLHLPRHAGGVSEVAAALARAWTSMDIDRLDGYIERLANGSVTRRLGVLVEALDLDRAARLDRYRPDRGWRGRSVLLDPSLPASGDLDRRWGVRLNVPIAELVAATRT